MPKVEVLCRYEMGQKFGFHSGSKSQQDSGYLVLLVPSLSKQSLCVDMNMIFS